MGRAKKDTEGDTRTVPPRGSPISQAEVTVGVYLRVRRQRNLPGEACAKAGPPQNGEFKLDSHSISRASRWM